MTTEWHKKIMDAGWHDGTRMTIDDFLLALGDKFIALYSLEMQVTVIDTSLIKGFAAVGKLNETEQMQCNSTEADQAMGMLWYELNKK